MTDMMQIAGLLGSDPFFAMPSPQGPGVRPPQPALGEIPALRRAPNTDAIMERPAFPPARELPGYINPSRALWGGFLTDMANHFLSGRTQGIGGLGAQSMFGAIRNNQALEQRQRDQYTQMLQDRLLHRRALSPTSDTDTAQMRNLAQYRALVEAGDPLAENFGRAAGLTIDDRGVVGGVQRLDNGNLGLVMGDGEVVDTDVEFYNETEAGRQMELEDAITDAFVNADQARRLADRFEAQAPNMRAGLFATAGEMVKSALGTQDDVSLLRTNYREFKNNQVIGSLPQGPASDKDVKIFMGGFPEDTDSPTYVASWLQGRAKLLQAEAEVQEARLKFFANGGARRDWPAELRRVLEGLEGTLFFPEFDDIGEDFEVEGGG